MYIIPPIRKQDRHGAGHYGASRGVRRHNGIDLACYAQTGVMTPVEGVVTKIGYPYNPDDKRKGHLRYVEVTDYEGYRHRFFYVSTELAVGSEVRLGERIGVAQGLLDVYPGITDHFHYEIKNEAGSFIDPGVWLKEAGYELA